MKFIVPLFITLLITACSETTTHRQSSKIDDSIILHAEHFKIVENLEDTLLYILSPTSGDVEKQYLLTKNPEKSKNGFTAIHYPVKNLITLSGTQIGMLDKIDETDRIVGISNVNYIHNENVISRFHEGDILEIGEASSMPLESLIEKDPDIILYSGFGTSFPNEQKLESLNILSMPIYDWQETNPLGKAEWIKLLGYLTDRVNEANTYFKTVVGEYETYRALANKYADSSTVMVGNLYGDVWNTPSGESYMAQLLEDANVNYIYSDSKGTGSLQLTLEEVVSKSNTSSHWINPGFPTQKEILNVNPKAKHLAPFQSNMIYCYSHEMNKYWELAAVEPQRVLHDLIRILHNDVIENELYFYKKVEP